MSSQLVSTWAPLPTTTRGDRIHMSSIEDKFSYCSGSTVVVREFEHPERCWSYAGHSNKTTASSISPCGLLVASGDERGVVQVWSIDSNSKKYEYTLLAGRVRDIAWDSESARLIAVGDGKIKYGVPIMVETGSSLGAITEHLSTVNTVSIRQQRPLRAITGGDDFSVAVHQGTPFKMLQMHRNQHSRYVMAARYSPNGARAVSVGLDSKITFYDGESGVKTSEITAAHAGGIYAVSWALDSSKIVTSSADCTVKLWDVETQQAIVTWQMGTSVSDQQLGNVFGKSIVTASLSGKLHYLDEKTGKIAKTLDGHVGGVFACEYCRSTDTLWTGGLDGQLFKWENGTPTVQGKVEGAITHLEMANNALACISRDCKFTVFKEKQAKSHQTRETPVSLAITSDETVYVACQSVFIKQNGESRTEYATKDYGERVAVSKDGKIVVVGSLSSNKIQIIVDNVKTEAKITFSGVNCLRIMQNQAKVMVGGVNGEIAMVNLKTSEQEAKFVGGHAGRVSHIRLRADDKYMVSCSVDSQIIVWNCERPLERQYIAAAHQGMVRSVDFKSDAEIISTGCDGCIKVWKI